jgi:DNA-binding MarR family transcriptional regulator
LYIQIKFSFRFVHTNFVFTIMKIEDVIKSNVKLSDATCAALNIMCTQNILNDKFNEILKPYDLSPEQYNVLRILRGQKGKPANMNDIQERMIAKTSNTTRLVDKLLLKNLVTREVCCGNRRKIDVQITEKGLQQLSELEPKIQEYDTFLARNLSEKELQQLNQLLEKYRTLKIN